MKDDEKRDLSEALNACYEARTYHEFRDAKKSARVVLRKWGHISEDRARYYWCQSKYSLDDILKAASREYRIESLRHELLALKPMETLPVLPEGGTFAYVCTRLPDRIRKKKVRRKK